MTSTRRQFAGIIAAAAGAAGLMGSRAIAAASDDGDPDNLPPNLFICPYGKPFRAAAGAPYPVADWFKAVDADADGKMSHAEYMTDAEAFFHFLDFHKSGVIDNFDISVYEHRLVPEILVNVSSANPPRLWLAQMGPGGGPMSGGGAPVGPPSPSGQEPNDPGPPKGLDESGQGASPYSFFDAPEPITAADRTFRGYITQTDFLAMADRHFSALDTDNAGFLVLAKLPKTRAQQWLEKARRRRS